MASRVTFPKVLAAGGAVGFGYYLYMRQHWFPDPRKQAMKTTGVENIEARYTAGGGAPDHQPGTATKIGDAHITEARHVNQGKPAAPTEKLDTKHQ